MDIRNAISEIRENGTDLYWWRKRFLTHIASRYFKAFKQSDSDPIYEYDWDSLIILDACRYDVFESLYGEYDIPGELSMRESLESGTPGFLRENFEDGQFHDTVYITANAYVNTLLDTDQFHEVIPAWKTEWNEDLQTVTPEAIGRLARRVIDEYPNKRHIIHFVQPHEPFIGEKRVGIRNESAVRLRAMGEEGTSPSNRKPTAFKRLARGELSTEEVRSAYRSNLERALPEVRSLLDEITGKTVVTADHGEAFGEFASPFPIRVYGHPLGVYIPALTNVPYLECQNGERRTIISEATKTTGQLDMEAANERLQMLGYTE